MRLLMREGSDGKGTKHLTSVYLLRCYTFQCHCDTATPTAAPVAYGSVRLGVAATVITLPSVPGSTLSKAASRPRLS